MNVALVAPAGMTTLVGASIVPLQPMFSVTSNGEALAGPDLDTERTIASPAMTDGLTRDRLSNPLRVTRIGMFVL